jgi:hypothetical protein
MLFQIEYEANTVDEFIDIIKDLYHGLVKNNELSEKDEKNNNDGEIKCIEEIENTVEVLRDCIRVIAKQFMLKPWPEVMYSVVPMQNIYTQFMDNLYDKIVAEDVLSRQLETIKEYIIHLKETYEVLENKYKTMERNFYDAFS